MTNKLIYTQSVIESTYTFADGTCKKETNAFSGIRYETNSIVKLNTSNDFSRLQINNTNLKKTVDKFISLSQLSYNHAKKMGVSFVSVMKKHDEYININTTVTDYRNFFYCRIALSGKTPPLYTDFEVDIDADIFENKFNYYYNRLLTQILSVSFESKKGLIQNVPIIFSPKSAGYFIHEIVGHLLETDISNSYMEINEIMENLIVTDSIDSVEQLLGLSKYDDNGVIIKPLLLIKDGKLCNTISIDKDKSMDNILYGMARRQSYRYPVLARMRNTFISPVGTLKEEDILNKYPKAFYIHQIFNGCCHPKLFKYMLSGIGSMVYDGTMTPTITNFNVKGNVISSLKKISEIGSNFEMTTSGCVKGEQIVHVCMGGPTLAIEDDQTYVEF